MKNVIFAILLAFASVGTASAEDRLTGAYNFGTSEYLDFLNLSVEKTVFTVKDTGGIAPSFYVGANVRQVTESSNTDAVYSASVGAELPLTSDNRFSFKGQYNYDFISGNDDTESFMVAGLFKGEAWRFQVDATKPSDFDWLYGLSGERKVGNDFSVGLRSVFDESDYAWTSVYGVWSF